MKKQVKVVIGANFGDEGKGLTTEYLAVRNPNSIVVRFNGGAQAAHTVVLPNSQEHVFSHFGSATLDGIPTYLSRFFLVNPILYAKEKADLLEKSNGALPFLYVDNNAIVTTPYDMMVNQIAEIVRGDERHGSCGYGISETVVRSGHNKYKIQVSDLRDVDKLRRRLIEIRDVYTPNRLQELGCLHIPENYVGPLSNDGIIDAFIADCEDFMESVHMVDVDILDQFDSIIMEGAQGLLLDQNREEYSPHITHSNTGMDNVSEILQDVSFKYDLEVVYITRCYMTRHGAGPFPNETEHKPYSKIYDPTNVPNMWQGTLRFGILDLDFLYRNIMDDVAKNIFADTAYSLMITCLDQIDDKAKFIDHGEYMETEISEFIYRLKTKFGDSWQMYGSWGRTRETVRIH